jgi:hypothetical protein
MFNFKKNKWILIPAITLLAFAFIGFSISTFYDLEAAEWLGKGMRYQIIKFIVVFYGCIGTTIWLIPIVIGVFIWIESFYPYKGTKKDSWFKANSNSIWYIYGLWFLLWLMLNTFLLYKSRNIDQGWGVGISVEYVTTWVYWFASKVIAFLVKQEYIFL